ncbi:MAG: hypothetical protein ABL986_18200 [Vicinamibacterales bacterium]
MNNAGRMTMMVAGAALVVAPVLVGVHAAQQGRPSATDLLVSGRSFEQPQPSAYPLEVPADLGAEILPVFGNVYMIARPTGNVVVQVGRDGVFVVDPGPENVAEKTLQAIRIITKAPVGYILNTTPERDAYGGNEKVAAAGQNPTVAPPPERLSGPGSVAPQNPFGGGGGGNPTRQDGAIIFAHENLLNRMSAPTGAAAAESVGFWPTNTYFTLRKTLWYNDEPIEIIHEPSAHTDGDSMVFFRHSDAIAAGPIIDTLAYPVPDAKRGGSISGILKGLNDIIDIAVPKYNQQGGTRIAPGRGRILNEADVVEYRDMMTIIRNRVKDGVDKGLTVQQVLATGPTLEYDPLYSTPKLTGQQLVETIYTDLKAAAARTPARR